MFYRIVVRSELTERYAGACEGMKMEVGRGQTTFTGQVIDPSHLCGLINHIGDLGLELLSVQALPEYAQSRGGAARDDPEEG